MDMVDEFLNEVVVACDASEGFFGELKQRRFSDRQAKALGMLGTIDTALRDFQRAFVRFAAGTAEERFVGWKLSEPFLETVCSAAARARNDILTFQEDFPHPDRVPRHEFEIRGRESTEARSVWRSSEVGPNLRDAMMAVLDAVRRVQIKKDEMLPFLEASLTPIETSMKKALHQTIYTIQEASLQLRMQHGEDHAYVASLDAIQQHLWEAQLWVVAAEKGGNTGLCHERARQNIDDAKAVAEAFSKENRERFIFVSAELAGMKRVEKGLVPRRTIRKCEAELAALHVPHEAVQELVNLFESFPGPRRVKADILRFRGRAVAGHPGGTD